MDKKQCPACKEVEQQQLSYKKYIVLVRANNDFISIRDTRYPLGSLPPSGEGRFHRQGQLAYYAASGDVTARAEVYRDPAAQIKPPYAPFQIPAGDYNLLDFRQYLVDHPNSCRQFFSDSGDRGWSNCQVLRDELEVVGCSGTIYSSVANPGGINIAVWPLDGTPLTESFFHKKTD
ncbi:MAG: RES family NAD+ phosphorylase [Candidatus Woesearchaeota archaeon]|nr:RES family NAD+ phosphorylase [Candidatus Woesearchaeota archaeon]